MKITNEKQIIFKQIYYAHGTNYSDIIFNGKSIGCLVEKQSSILNPISETYQMLSPEDKKDNFDGWYESEDIGFIFGYFNSLDKFINYYNSIN